MLVLVLIDAFGSPVVVPWAFAATPLAHIKPERATIRNKLIEILLLVCKCP